jgi:dihydroorotate dehydrogenase
MLYRLLRPLLFRVPAEQAHRLTLMALGAAPLARRLAPEPALTQRVAGIVFPNPVGMAPGFDKNAQVPDAVLRLGFGFTEIGTVTPRPQAGTRAPAVPAGGGPGGHQPHGLQQQRRGCGGRAVARPPGQAGDRGRQHRRQQGSADRIADYAAMTRTMAPLATYLTVNISSPNTPGLRALQDEGALAELLDAVIEARGALATPVFLKLAPDLQRADVDAICRIALDRRLDALIVSNTTIERPASLRSVHAAETGGLSGEPLRQMALERLREFRKASGGAIPLIGVGGIASADDAWQRIRAGASLVQIYSAMVYEGPGLARAIVTGLAKRVRQEGMTSIAEAVGTE